MHQAKAQSECKIKDLVVKLAEREAEVTNLEMRLKTLAYDEQMPIPRATVNNFNVKLILALIFDLNKLD